MPGLLVVLGSVGLAIAIALSIDGSYWGLVIAWFFGTWGAMLLAWGLVAGWYRSVVACVISALFALSAIVVALAFVPPGAWAIAIMCAIGNGLALFFSVYQVYARFSSSSRSRSA